MSWSRTFLDRMMSFFGASRLFRSAEPDFPETFLDTRDLTGTGSVTVRYDAAVALLALNDNDLAALGLSRQTLRQVQMDQGAQDFSTCLHQRGWAGACIHQATETNTDHDAEVQ